MTIYKSASDWTPTHVQQYWNWIGSNSYLHHTFFSHLNGRGIVNFLAATGKLKGKVLDYGCGVGHLLNLFLKRGLECYGVDFSPDSIAVVNQKFSNYPNWKEGVTIENLVTPYSDNSFHVITCIETLEHLPDNLLQPMLAELKRLVKPGGMVVLTTPFAENFEENMAYCPFCDSVFHKWQHMRSLTIEYMESLLVSSGFHVEFCRNLDFEEFKRSVSLKPLDELSLAKFNVWLASKTIKLLDKLFPVPFPGAREVKFRLDSGHGRHLCALATRR